MNSQLMSIKKAVAIFMSFAIALLPLKASAEVWGPDVNLEARGGDKRTITTGEVMWPFILGKSTGGFVDVRAKRTNLHEDGVDLDDSLEYNIGGGVKHAFRYAPLDLESRKMVFGAYGYYDKIETSLENEFNQVTVGAELLGDNIRLRSNYYSPEDKSVPISPTFFSGITYSGNSVFVNRSELVEKPLSGYDAELGLRLLKSPVSIWGLTKYHNFSANNVPDKTGRRYRLQGEVPLNNIMNGAHIVAGGEHIANDKDNLYPSETNGYIRFSLPLGATEYDGKTSDDVNSVADRMTRRPERDIDIVTSSGARIASKTKATDPSGDTYNITVVGRDWNDDKEGEGTFDDPTKLKNVPEKLEDGDILLVQSKSGITPAQRGTTSFDGVTIDNQVRITGSNAPLLVRNPKTGNTYLDQMPGESSQPAVLRSADHDGSDGVIELAKGASGSTIDNVQFTGFNALQLTDVSGISLNSISTKGFGQSAIVADSASVTMQNSSTEAPVTLKGGSGSSSASFVAQNWEGSSYASDTEGAESNPNSLVLDEYEGTAQVNSSDLDGRVNIKESDADLALYNTTISVQNSEDTSSISAINSQNGDQSRVSLTATTLDSTIQSEGSSTNFGLTGASVNGIQAPTIIADRATQSFNLENYGGAITINDETKVYGQIDVNSSSLDMTIANSTISAPSDTGAGAVSFTGSSGNYALNNTTATGNHQFDGDMTVSINNGSIINTNTGNDKAMTLSGSDNITIDGSNINGAITADGADGQLTVRNGSSIGNGSDKALSLAHDGTVDVQGSTLNGIVEIGGTGGDTESGASAAVSITNSTINTGVSGSDAGVRFNNHEGPVTISNLSDTISGSLEMDKQTGDVQISNVAIGGDVIENQSSGLIEFTNSTIDGSGEPGQAALEITNRTGGDQFTSDIVRLNGTVINKNGAEFSTGDDANPVKVQIRNGSSITGDVITSSFNGTVDIDNSSINNGDLSLNGDGDNTVTANLNDVNVSSGDISINNEAAINATISQSEAANLDVSTTASGDYEYDLGGNTISNAVNLTAGDSTPTISVLGTSGASTIEVGVQGPSCIEVGTSGNNSVDPALSNSGDTAYVAQSVSDAGSTSGNFADESGECSF